MQPQCHLSRHEIFRIPKEGKLPLIANCKKTTGWHLQSTISAEAGSWRNTTSRDFAAIFQSVLGSRPAPPGTLPYLETDRESRPAYARRSLLIQSQVVVDDERNTRNTLGMVLEAEGCKADTASNGDVALPRVKQGLYDIAFIDIQMPKMDGLELLRYIRGLRPKWPVAMLTAYGIVSRASRL